MKLKKIIKTTLIGAGAYLLLDAGFQMGKGYMLKTMEKHNLTVDKAKEVVDFGIDESKGLEKLRFNIIKTSSKTEW